VHDSIVATRPPRNANPARTTARNHTVRCCVVEGDEEFDDDALTSWSPGPPTDRVWRHPSEIYARVATVEPEPTMGFPFRTLVASFGVALAVTVIATTVATVVVSSRQDSRAAQGTGFGYPVTTIDEQLQQLYTLVVDDGSGRRSIPALVLDGLGTIVTSLAGLNKASSVSEPAYAGNTAANLPVQKATQSQLAVVQGSPNTPLSPLGSCKSLKLAASVQVMTADGSTAGEITALGMVQLDNANEPSTPVVIVRTSGSLDATNSVLWQDGKIVALGVRRQNDGQLIAIPTDVAIGLARAAAHGESAMPWLGIGGIDTAEGVKVDNVTNGSPADHMLKTGDVVMAIDGQPVTSMWSLAVTLRRYSAQDTVELRVITAGQTYNMKITLSAKPGAAVPVGTTTSSPVQPVLQTR
jgi:S1-C subfamily serine protease